MDAFERMVVLEKTPEGPLDRKDQSLKVLLPAKKEPKKEM